MPETLKRLREPAALAAVVFAGLVILVGIINLLAPPGNSGVPTPFGIRGFNDTAPPFANRAFDQATAFLDFNVAVAVAFAVYLANYVTPKLDKARLITLIALVEVGLAALFGVVTALAQFGASGIDGESKFLKFLEALGGGAVIAVAGLFVWFTWQTFLPATQSSNPGAAYIGGNWPGRPGGGTGAGGGAGVPGQGQQQYGQPSPPPGGFGWTPQQSNPTAFGQQGGQQPPQPPQPGGYGQPPQVPGPGVAGAGAPQPFGADRTQMLPPVQSGQGQPGQMGQPSQLGQPGQQNQPGQPGQLGLSPQPGQPGSSGQPGQSGQHGYGQQPPQAPQAMGQPSGFSDSSSQQNQPPLPPSMQGYAAEPSPWSPGGPGAGAGGQHGLPPQPAMPMPGMPQPGAQHPGMPQPGMPQPGMPQPGQQNHPGQGQGQELGQSEGVSPQLPTQQIPQARGEEPEDQRPSPFQIGDWRSE